jgi:hypothetical protein
METSHKEIAAETKPDRDMEEMACRETTEAHLVMDEETMACQEMEARLDEEEPTSVETKPEVAQQQEVPKEDTVVQPVKGRKRRLRGKKQAAGRRREPKKLTREDCGPRMQLAASCRKVSRRATVAWRKRIIFRKL